MIKKQKGFSLIELLIVVAIILIIAAIAIPNLLRSRMAANEASAVGSVRTIVTSEVTYTSTYGVGFAPTLADLGGTTSPCVAASTSACLLDSVLSAGTKSGYAFLATGGGGSGTASVPDTTFEASGIPVSASTGTRAFCSDESGVIRFLAAGVGASDPATDTACEAWTPLQ
ncbi:MAG TPA: prepilin-type N-terminal cleavage/methylation domain-containing protein [Candidatus Acidoferrales bacterium]|nr:prepilin-type N-terminal cleavage/methylation domain-containing protein [Candidatus Acidoferrales bacterium]